MASDPFRAVGHTIRYEAPPANAGQGNAYFIADLAAGVPDEEMRSRFKAGRYPFLHIASVQGWRKLAGRS